MWLRQSDVIKIDKQDSQKETIIKNTDLMQGLHMYSSIRKTVSYGREGVKEPRRDFTWILDLYKDCCDEQKDVVVEVGNLRFMIEFPNHKNCESEYKKNVDSFLRKGHANVLTLNALGIDTVHDTATENEKSTKSNTLSKDPLYVEIKKIAMGGFGDVRKVKNVSNYGQNV